MSQSVQVQTAQAPAPKPKLKAYGGSKFSGKRDEFEAFKAAYDARRLLNAENFQGWKKKDQVAFLVSAVEDKALEVVRASIATQGNNVNYAMVCE